MNDRHNSAFEILHLLTAVSSRFEVIFSECSDAADGKNHLTAEHFYILTYIDNFGVKYENKKVVQRDGLTKLLREFFKLTKDSPGKILRELEHKFQMIGDFDIPEDDENFPFEQGRRRVLSLESNGERKISEFAEALENLKLELLEGEKDVLRIPNHYSDADQKHRITQKLLSLFDKMHL